MTQASRLVGKLEAIHGRCLGSRQPASNIPHYIYQYQFPLLTTLTTASTAVTSTAP
jgi:hypothetical protein